jgi:hypothetical protein
LTAPQAHRRRLVRVPTTRNRPQARRAHGCSLVDHAAPLCPGPSSPCRRCSASKPMRWARCADHAARVAQGASLTCSTGTNGAARPQSLRVRRRGRSGRRPPREAERLASPPTARRQAWPGARPIRQVIGTRYALGVLGCAGRIHARARPDAARRQLNCVRNTEISAGGQRAERAPNPLNRWDWRGA